MILQYLTSLRIKINLKNAKDKTRRGVGRRVAFFDCILKIASKRKKGNVIMVTNVGLMTSFGLHTDFRRIITNILWLVELKEF